MIKNIDFALFQKRYDKLDVLARPYYLKANIAAQARIIAQQLDEDNKLRAYESSMPRCAEYEDDIFRLQKQIKENIQNFNDGLRISQLLTEIYMKKNFKK